MATAMASMDEKGALIGQLLVAVHFFSAKSKFFKRFTQKYQIPRQNGGESLHKTASQKKPR